MKRLAIITIAFALLITSGANAYDRSAYDGSEVVHAGDTFKVPCWMPGKNAHVYTARSYGTTPLNLDAYYPPDESWVEYWSRGRAWSATVTSENLAGINPSGPHSIKTLMHNTGARAVVFKYTCGVWAP